MLFGEKCPLVHTGVCMCIIKMENYPLLVPSNHGCDILKLHVGVLMNDALIDNLQWFLFWSTASRVVWVHAHCLDGSRTVLPFGWLEFNRIRRTGLWLQVPVSRDDGLSLRTYNNGLSLRTYNKRKFRITCDSKAASWLNKNSTSIISHVWLVLEKSLI